MPAETNGLIAIGPVEPSLPRHVTPPLAAIRWDLRPVISEPAGPLLEFALAFLKQPTPDVLDRDPHWRASFLVERLALALIDRDADAAAYREALHGEGDLLHEQHVKIERQGRRIADLIEESRNLRRPA
jgi:hypothetical protein